MGVVFSLKKEAEMEVTLLAVPPRSARAGAKKLIDKVGLFSENQYGSYG